jgi:hypothetical protein
MKPRSLAFLTVSLTTGLIVLSLGLARALVGATKYGHTPLRSVFDAALAGALALYALFVIVWTLGAPKWRRLMPCAVVAWWLGVERAVPPRLPGGFGSIRMWEFALPFALQPPFSPSDPLTSTTLLESPAVYCCPLTVWWNDQRPRLRALASGPPEEGVDVTVLDWDAPHKTVTAGHVMITRGFLKEQLAASTSGRRRAARLLDALSAGAGPATTLLPPFDEEKPPVGSRPVR